MSNTHQIVTIVNSTKCDIRDFETEIIASLKATGTLPEELADLFTVEILKGCNPDGSDRFILRAA